MAVKFRTVLACRDTLAAGYVETPFDRLGQDAAPDSAPALATIRASRHWWRERGDMIAAPLAETDLDIVAAHRGYGLVMPVEVSSFAELQSRVIDRAWRDGAWDMIEHHYPPITGNNLGVVSANRRWLDAERAQFRQDSPRPHLERWLTDAAQAGSLIIWAWRPMVGNPYLKHWLAKDESLAPDGSRTGNAPFSARSGSGKSRHYVFGKGQIPLNNPKRGRARPRPTPSATPRQRQYLTALMRRAGRSPAQIPNMLTRQQASAMIDMLLGAAKE